MIFLTVEMFRGISLAIYGFIAPALFDWFTRESHGRFKVVLITDLLLIISAFIYAYIHVNSNYFLFKHLKTTGF